MKVLNAFPNGHGGLTLPQVRVMRALAEVETPMTKTRLSKLIGNKTPVVVIRAIGFSDVKKRHEFEQTKDGGGAPGRPRPSLLTLGYVRELELKIPADGICEIVYQLTPKGRKILRSLSGVDLPPLRERGNSNGHV